MKRFLTKPIVITVLLSLVLFSLGAGYAKLSGTKAPSSKAGGIFTASGSVITTINRSSFSNPTSIPYGNVSASYTSSTVLWTDQSVPASTSGSLMVGSAGTSQIQYVSSLSLDGSANFYANSYGTGSINHTQLITAGQPYMWDANTSGANSMPLSNTSSWVFAAGTTAGGLATSVTASTVVMGATWQ